MRYLSFLLFVFLTGCLGVPEGIEPVGDFELNRYLGKWYEIARLDHSFERGLEQVTAEYSLREDGGVRVLNRGFEPGADTWKESEGTAYFVGDPETGHLKVSFFGPFYGSYIVFGLGDNYEYSLVTGSDRSYLWLLSRTPTMEDALQEELLGRLEDLGFATESLIFVDQSED